MGAGEDNLYLIPTSTSPLNGAGNALDNIISASDVAGMLFGDVPNMLWGDAGADSLFGAKGNDVLYGSAPGVDDDVTADYLDGGSGDDVLYGNGNDVLSGGSGSDVYVISGAGNQIIESSYEEIDTVRASVSFSLGLSVALPDMPLPQGVTGVIERLELIGTANLIGLGNSVANVMIGNDGNNTLMGGAGEDTLSGGNGDDVLYSNVINGSANAVVDRLYGEAGNDTLYGDGYDNLFGGVGDDVYYLTGLFNAVYEDANAGVDTVKTAKSFSIDPRGENTEGWGWGMENVELLGTASIKAYGDSNDNVLTGNSGANLLDGRGGHDVLNGGGGADTLQVSMALDPLSHGNQNVQLTGGAGKDIFAFSAGAVGKLVGADNTVLVTDFVHNADKLAFFSNTTPASLATLSVSPGATLDDMLELAAQQMSTVTAVSKFVFAGNTYVVVDRSADAFFANTDTAIKLTGTPVLTLTDFTFTQSAPL